MNAQTLSMTAPAPDRAARRPGVLRAMVAEALGWVAYGLFYVTILGTLVGLPVAFGIYLVGLQN